MKKSKYILKTTLILALGIIFLTSCSSDADDVPEPENNKKKSSYSLTLQDGQKYADSWDSIEQGGSTVSSYKITSKGNEGFLLSVNDEKETISLEGKLSLNPATEQPFPLRYSDDGWSEDSDFSLFHIAIGDIDYRASSGTAKLSNLKKTDMLPGVGGFASYDLAVEGIFYKFDPSDPDHDPYVDKDEREQVKITGTFNIRSDILSF